MAPISVNGLWPLFFGLPVRRQKPISAKYNPYVLLIPIHLPFAFKLLGRSKTSYVMGLYLIDTNNTFSWKIKRSGRWIGNFKHTRVILSWNGLPAIDKEAEDENDAEYIFPL